MKKSRLTEGLIANVPRQAESGAAVADFCRQLGVSEARLYVRKKTLAPRGRTEMRRLP